MSQTVIIVTAGMAASEAMRLLAEVGIQDTIVVEDLDLMGDALERLCVPEERGVYRFSADKVDMTVPYIVKDNHHTHPTSPRSQRHKGRRNW
jgi:hypothetical protein